MLSLLSEIFVVHTFPTESGCFVGRMTKIWQPKSSAGIPRISVLKMLSTDFIRVVNIRTIHSHVTVAKDWTVMFEMPSLKAQEIANIRMKIRLAQQPFILMIKICNKHTHTHTSLIVEFWYWVLCCERNAFPFAELVSLSCCVCALFFSSFLF